ncbi:deoxyribose-phosphate aldolase [Mycoplasma sp. P36-A1]|uniref:deoxyribose-phosphate aldolase n=1 Tax=Mycoplasma sp. P36-A1 TaxID=3252900 RepID=UPI003C3037FC
MKLSKYIDHTLLKAEATKEQIHTLCQEAISNDFASVCVNPFWVKYCAEILEEETVDVCTVIGFPLGANTKEVKYFEAKDAIVNGAAEVDMVINIGALKSGFYDVVLDDIKAVVSAANQEALVKVIIETSLLNEEEKIKACELAMEAGADFVKTSTGFSTGGATVADVKLMKSVVKDLLQVKASGGVRTPEDFNAMIEAGATRIGTSNGIALVSNESAPKGSY